MVENDSVAKLIPQSSEVITPLGGILQHMHYRLHLVVSIYTRSTGQSPLTSCNQSSLFAPIKNPLNYYYCQWTYGGGVGSRTRVLPAVCCSQQLTELYSNPIPWDCQD